MVARLIATLTGLVVTATGVAGIIDPFDARGARYSVTGSNLYQLAAFWLVTGFAQLAASRRSWDERTMRVLGFTAIALGMSAAMVDLDQARDILEFLDDMGPGGLRVGAAIVAVFGLFLSSSFVWTRMDTYR